MYNVFISTTSFGKEDLSPLERCKKVANVTVNPFNRKIVSAELVGLASDAEGIIAGTETYDKELLDRLLKLKVISRCGVGVENIDNEYARHLGIKIYSIPDGPTLAVAELTVGLMFALLRNITLADRKMRLHKWEKNMGSLLNGKKIGLIGLGRIGRKVAELLFSLGAQIAYYDLEQRNSGAPFVFIEFKELLSWADIITLHCSALNTDKKLMGIQEFRQMKKGAFFVNTARGQLVDEEALYAVLKESYLSGAALDVYGAEPYNGAFLELENVILTPHIGSYARESRVNMEMQAVVNLLEGLKEARRNL